MRIVIDNKYIHLKEALKDMPGMFDRKEGQLLFDGRNQVRLVEINGYPIVLKRFRKRDFIGQLKHTFIRKNKARRAYEKAHELLRRGFDTPYPIAYLETRRFGIIRRVYFACEYTTAQPIRLRLIDQQPFDKDFAIAYAGYIAHLHEAGILHRDLNSVNVLFTEKDGQIHFQLIDINRMHFYRHPVSKKKSMKEWNLFWWLSDVYRFTIKAYADARQWTSGDIAKTILLKQCHDEKWEKSGKYNQKIFGQRPLEIL